MEGGLVMVQRFLEQGQCLLAALQLLLRRLLREVGELEVTGELGLLTGQPHACAAVASSPSEVLVLPVPGRLRPACVGSRGAFAAPLVHIRSSSLATLQADAQKARVQGPEWFREPSHERG